MSNSEYNFNKLPGETSFQHLKRVCIDKINKLHNKEWTDIKEEFNFVHSSDNLRKYSKGWHLEWEALRLEWEATQLDKDNEIAKEEVDVTAKYKSTNKLNADGSTDSDKLLKMSEAQSKDKNYLLEAHGFDANEFELLSAQSSIWNGGNVDVTLYSSKIKVKVKEEKFDYEKVLNKVLSNKSPYKRSKIVEDGKNLLEIFLTDMHFGVNSFDEYKSTLDEILELIESKKWDTIYIPIGSDMLHNNDLSKGVTVNLTYIEKVDMELAWEEAYSFYEILISHALENANKVVAHYVCGNHDKDSAFGLVKALSKVFTEVEWDTSSNNKKLFTWKDIAILVMHGDKGTSRIPKTIYKEYGKLIADKKTVEIHTGDRHHTKTDDSSGIIFRILPTKAKVDQWHTEQSFTASMRCFHIFEYNEEVLKTIYHV